MVNLQNGKSIFYLIKWKFVNFFSKIDFIGSNFENISIYSYA